MYFPQAFIVIFQQSRVKRKRSENCFSLERRAECRVQAVWAALWHQCQQLAAAAADSTNMPISTATNTHTHTCTLEQSTCKYSQATAEARGGHAVDERQKSFWQIVLHTFVRAFKCGYCCALKTLPANGRAPGGGVCVWRGRLNSCPASQCFCQLKAITTSAL